VSDETLRIVAEQDPRGDYAPSMARELLSARAVVEAARTLLAEALAVGKRGGRGRPPNADALIAALAKYDEEVGA